MYAKLWIFPKIFFVNRAPGWYITLPCSGPVASVCGVDCLQRLISEAY